VIDRAVLHRDRVAVVDADGRAHSYAELLDRSARVASALLGDRDDLGEARVCYLTRRSFDYPVLQWGIWRAGGLAVPLAESHPPREWDYVLQDADPDMLVADSEYYPLIESLAQDRGLRLLHLSDACIGDTAKELPPIEASRRALMVYTSGTTGRPKGVVTTHGNVTAQVDALRKAWEWTQDDHILLVLPLHHVHGMINVLGCALASGAACHMTTSFDAEEIWESFARAELTLFMAVPTVYAKLITAWEEADGTIRARWSEGAQSLRLMVSGSAALPVRTLRRWQEITKHTLLERYGMTEIGMGLSNPLHGERRPGHVGGPLPGVEIRRMSPEGGLVDSPDEPGELQIRGPAVFLEYWRQPEVTAAAFQETWFRTGDMAVIDDGHYRLLGRTSVDILKCGGYKVSALEIEEVLREHIGVKDCAVVGLPDEEWGQRIAAAVVKQPGAAGDVLDADALAAFAKERLAPYKLPREWCFLGDLPRNAMGKVVKPDVNKLFADRAREGGTAR
jgi:malonyl-CoA/methylmalonyl-CoA synthetase